MRHGSLTIALLALLALTPFGVSIFGVPVAVAEDPAPAAPAAPSDDETRGYVGYSVNFIRGLNPEQRKEMKITRPEGLFIASVLLEGPAEKGGLQVGDVLLKMNGKDIPDTKGVDLDKDGAADEFLKGPWRTVTGSTKPGDAVELVVDRGGTTVTVKAVAMDKATMERLTANQTEEQASVQVPKPVGRGEPAEATYDFEKLADDAVRPDHMLNVTGYWEGAKEQGKAPENTVLRQSSDTGGDFAVCLVTADGRVYKNGRITVRIQLVDGETSRSGGIVVRARDRKNWYGILVDGVAQDMRIVAMKANKPVVLAKTPIGSPKPKTWHTLEVTFDGETISAVLNGAQKVEAKDEDVAAGWCGLLTTGDTDTWFDDFKIVPAK